LLILPGGCAFKIALRLLSIRFNKVVEDGEFEWIPSSSNSFILLVVVMLVTSPLFKSKYIKTSND
jgi:hypothetical protein